MTADALLAAVLADPDADLPRLVYADHLDDTGQPERAEFIRVQCELAKLDEWDDRRPTLEDREHELLDRHEAEWLGKVPAEVWEWDWLRGFVDRVHIGDIWRPCNGFDHVHPVTKLASAGSALGRECCWTDTIRALAFDDLRDQSELVTQLSQGRWPAVKSLSFGTTRLHSPDLDELGRCAVGGRLTEFYTADPQLHPGTLADHMVNAPLSVLGVPDTLLDTAALGRLLSSFTQLTSFDVDGGELAGDAVAQFQPLTEPSLTALDVSGTELGRVHLAELLAVPGLAGLIDLQANRCEGYHSFYRELANTPFWSQATSLRVHSAHAWREDFLAFCRTAGPPTLRLLDVADNDLGLDCVRALADAPWGGSLTWLALSRNGLGSPAVTALVADGRLRYLRTLHLAFDPHTDETARLLAATPSLARLRILTLNGTRLTDAAVSTVLDAPHWRLSGLGLSDLDLGERTVHALAASPRLRRLQWLDLSGNRRLGGDALMPLAESPHLSRLCELDVGGIDLSDRTRAALRERLGRRLSD